MCRSKCVAAAAGLSPLIVVLASFAPGAQATSPVPDWYVDESLYPQAYGVLASEKLMLPVDHGDWPLKIDNSRQLFLDDYLIASSYNIEREVHQVTKHPGNPVLVGDLPWEGGHIVGQIVRRDETTGRFRMWYAGWLRDGLLRGITDEFPALYAESDDGITWNKPELGIHECNGTMANNVIIPTGMLCGLIIDPQDPDPDRRYKGVVAQGVGQQPLSEGGYYYYTAPDGIHWNQAREEPIAVSLSSWSLPQNGIGDTSLFRWDRHLGKYVGDVKFVLPGTIRCRGIMESDDLVHWTLPRMTLYPDELDASDSQVYGHLSFCYESMWIGFLRVMHTQVGWKQTTVELTASRNGRNWSRVGRREEIIPLGGADDWDADYHDPSGDPVVMDDELYTYYRSVRLRDSPNEVHAVGLARVRRDGFVSLNGGETTGLLTTRPLAFPDSKLFINADVQAGGWIKVGLLSPGNEPIPDYSLSDAVPIIVDSVEAPVAWATASEFELPEGEHVRLQFELNKAKLYAFWFGVKLPTIVQQPQPQDVAPRATATFTILATDEGPLTYQWQKDGVDLSDDADISGANATTLQIANVGVDDEANYRCVVTGDGGSTTSYSATLTLIVGPGDFDRDGDVDQEDFGHFQLCLFGSFVPYEAGCEDSDLDQDDNVDQDDFAIFLRCMSGANLPADPNCAD